jgi:hypothetical protein
MYLGPDQQAQYRHEAATNQRMLADEFQYLVHYASFPVQLILSFDLEKFCDAQSFSIFPIFKI